MNTRDKQFDSVKIMLLLAFLTFLGSETKDIQAQPIPPSLLWSHPFDGEEDMDPVGVYLDGITLQFNLISLEKVTMTVTHDGQSFEGRTVVDDKTSQAVFALERPLPYEAEIVVMWRAKALLGGEGQGTFTFTTISDVPTFVVSITPQPGIPVPRETLREDGITIMFNKAIEKKLSVDVTADSHELRHWRAKVSEDGYCARLTAGELSYDTRVFLEWKDRFDRIRRTTGEITWDTEIGFELHFPNQGGYTFQYEVSSEDDLYIDLEDDGIFESSERIAIEVEAERLITYCLATITNLTTGESETMNTDFHPDIEGRVIIWTCAPLQPETEYEVVVNLTDTNDKYGICRIFIPEWEEDDDEDQDD